MWERLIKMWWFRPPSGISTPVGERYRTRAATSMLLLDRVVARKSGGAFELNDERVERAVLMVRRAEIAQPRVWFALDGLRQCRGHARFADPRLPRHKHHPPLAGLCLLPAPQQQVELFVAPDGPRAGRRLAATGSYSDSHLRRKITSVASSIGKNPRCEPRLR
jgi:hypothetical protein